MELCERPYCAPCHRGSDSRQIKTYPRNVFSNANHETVRAERGKRISCRVTAEATVAAENRPDQPDGVRMYSEGWRGGLRARMEPSVYLTSTPIERQVPSMVRIAASTVAACRSTIFFSAISRILALVMVPALVTRFLPEPYSRPASLRTRRDAGGVLYFTSYERSS